MQNYAIRFELIANHLYWLLKGKSLFVIHIENLPWFCTVIPILTS